MYDAVAVGELLIDLTSIGTNDDGYPTLSAHPGGAPVNYLAAMSKLGYETAFIGKVGADLFGDLLIKTLRGIGIDTAGIVRSEDHFTTLAFVTLDENGNRDFSFARKHGADIMLEHSEIDMSIVKGSKVLHFGTLSLTDEPARTATRELIATAKEKGLLISFDPNLRKPLWPTLEQAREQILFGLASSDVIKISDEEIDFLWGLPPEAGARKILDEFEAKLVFVTCGPHGAFYANRYSVGHVPGPKGLKVIDTTGAGDIFGGSAMGCMLRTGKAPDELDDTELRAITTYACAAASLSTTLPGALLSIPEEAQVSEFISCSV